jgi:hypothetical protein
MREHTDAKLIFYQFMDFDMLTGIATMKRLQSALENLMLSCLKFYKPCNPGCAGNYC